MTTVTIFLCVTLFVMAFMQTVYVVRFSQILKSPVKPRELTDDQCPVADVVMCVRGNDPHLADCLRAVVSQDYPNFTFHVVVDSDKDPAYAVVQEICAPLPLAVIHILNEPRESCSLKCSSLVHALSQLKDSEFVALLDSDTVPNANWLRRMASGFSEDNIAAVSAIRWYSPPNRQTGTVVRYVWNAAAIVQMVLYRIAWGGSLAITRKAIDELTLLELWKTSFCEDTMLKSELKKKSFTISYGSGLFVANRESCSLAEFSYWLQRQLLTVRLYHPNWRWVVGHSVGTTLATISTLGVAFYSISVGQLNSAFVLATAFLVYQIINVWLLKEINRCVLKNSSDKTFVPRIPMVQLWMASVMAQYIYFWAVIRASILRSVKWRGVEYKINGPWDIRLSKYRPYESSNEPSKNSL